jgi:predicted metal-binding protein
MMYKVIEYILCYFMAFFLGFFTCGLCAMYVVYMYGQKLKTRAVMAVRAKHAKRDKR